jgi:hypothetical protein
MPHFWNTARQLALHRRFDEVSLSKHLECFDAGYSRGIADVCGFVRADEWMTLVHGISRRLVRERSALQAGCWLAGVLTGRADEERHNVPTGRLDYRVQVRHRFCELWETGHIAQRALECGPSAVGLIRIFSALFSAGKIPPVADRLGSTLSDRIATDRQAA